MKGQTIRLNKLTSRNDLMEDLSEIRYPGTLRKIGESTMWRWCKDAGIETRLSYFDNAQCFALAQVAQFYRQGFSKNQVRTHFGVSNDYRNSGKARSQRQRVWQEYESTEYESTFDFQTGTGSGGWNFAEIGRTRSAG